MRFDNVGLFWQDIKVERIKKEKVVRIPPDPVWLRPEYLPNIEEAYDWEPSQFTDAELLAAAKAGERLVWDTESYPNYWSAGFQSVDSGKCLIFEQDDQGLSFDRAKLAWVLKHFTLIDFNGEGYDKWTTAIALKAYSTCEDMWQATVELIQYGVRGWQVLRDFKARKLYINHIDLYELTPLSPSLKVMAGRLGSALMMDLPFKPGTYLSYAQQRIVRWYMFNDNRNTELLYRAHLENIKLREEFGPLYKTDLRSKSDAQIAESVFRAEVYNRTGRHADAPGIRPGHEFRFNMPTWVQFQTPELKWLKQAVIDGVFTISPNGYVIEPPAFKDLLIPIGDMRYSFGVGGLHSTEENSAHSIYENGEVRHILRDFDVASYYPKLILGSKMVPPAIGDAFVSIYTGILDRRVIEKARDKKGAWALGLKIVLNGAFGKLMDPWSVLYCPELGMQTTISGQLALFMMIELAFLHGFKVTNANTDGVVIKCPIEREGELKAMIKEWEHATDLEMEATDYVATFSRDVNNYIAIDSELKAKRKGFYQLSAVDRKNFDNETIKKNPAVEICSDAICDFLTKGIPIKSSIENCRNINKFITVRNVRGGGAYICDSEPPLYIGKVARWYYSVGATGQIVTAAKGHLVATSENSKPIMRYTEEFPGDVDYEKYIQIAEENLKLLGYYELVS